MYITLRSRVLLFYSPYGGVGKTTLAVNTAIFNALSGKRTLLVDMSFYESITSMLRIPDKGGMGLSRLITMLELDGEKLSVPAFIDLFNSSVVHSNIGGELDVLISAGPVKTESLTEQETKVLLDILPGLGYDVIIIDTSSEMSEKNMVLIEAADGVVIPIIQDINCGWSLFLFKDVMDKFIPENKKFRLVINKWSKYSGFNTAELEGEIKYKIIGEIPYFQKEYQNHLNNGELIHTMKNKKAFEAFKKAAVSILSEEWSSLERGKDDQV